MPVALIIAFTAEMIAGWGRGRCLDVRIAILRDADGFVYILVMLATDFLDLLMPGLRRRLISWEG